MRPKEVKMKGNVKQVVEFLYWYNGIIKLIRTTLTPRLSLLKYNTL
jgi:hypothetical protein